MLRWKEQFGEALMLAEVFPCSWWVLHVLPGPYGSFIVTKIVQKCLSCCCSVWGNLNIPWQYFRHCIIPLFWGYDFVTLKIVAVECAAVLYVTKDGTRPVYISLYLMVCCHTSFSGVTSGSTAVLILALCNSGCCKCFSKIFAFKNPEYSAVSVCCFSWGHGDFIRCCVYSSFPDDADIEHFL